MDKVTSRKRVLAHLTKMDRTEHAQKSAAILTSLLGDPAFQNAKTIGVTVSAFPEVDTLALIEHCWNIGKKVAVPKCEPLTHAMDFYAIDHFGQLETVYMKLKEPKISETEYVSANDIDLMVVPGVVYSETGYRIGFGGGYFDRYLVSFNGETRSLAFDVQLEKSVPVEVHDVPVKGIHTESVYIDTEKVNR
ncbi:5-formyltetrahydrofolate cyclo-ligase [Planococcus sp. YIM B11945]|uniref:5-formyltetrahydrofolate cyclo-ligase n=1 Tax=Planococcus sp. YIM B11945 TaxID=3435410 RepID=UPI003D7CC07E